MESSRPDPANAVAGSRGTKRHASASCAIRRDQTIGHGRTRACEGNDHASYCHSSYGLACPLSVASRGVVGRMRFKRDLESRSPFNGARGRINSAPKGDRRTRRAQCGDPSVGTIASEDFLEHARGNQRIAKWSKVTQAEIDNALESPPKSLSTQQRTEFIQRL